MEKHLDVLLALVALVGLVNGLAGGAGGGAAAGSTGKTSNDGSASGLHGSAGSSGASNSTLGLGNGAGGGSVGGASAGGGLGGSPGGTVDAKSTEKPSNGGNSTLLSGGTSSSGPSNSSSGPSVGEGGGGRGPSDVAAGGTSGARGGSNREPGSNPSTSGTSSGGSGFREGRNSGPGAPSSGENRNDGGSGLAGTTPGSGPFGRDSGLDVGRRGPGLSLVEVGRRAGASGAEGGRLGGELFAGGLDFPSAFGGSSDYNRDEDHDFPASGSLSGSSGFGGGGRSGGFSVGTPGFGAFGRPVTGTSIHGVGRRAGASTRGRGPLGGDQRSDEGLEFGGAFGRSGDSYTRPGNRSPGNSFSRWSSGLGEPGLYGDFGAGSFGENFNGGAGGTGGGTPGFGAFGSGSGTDFSSRPPGYRFPAGLDGRTGSDGISSGGGDEVFSGSYPPQSPGAFSDSDTGPGGSPGWPTRDSFNDFGSSDRDSSPGLSSPAAPASGGSEPSRLWPRLWRGGRGGRRLFRLRDRLRKPDPRFAAAVALRTLTGAAAISRLGVSLAAAIHANRRKAQAGFGGHRRGCIGRGCDRERRLYEGLRVADDILTRIPLKFARLY